MVLLTVKSGFTSQHYDLYLLNTNNKVIRGLGASSATDLYFICFSGYEFSLCMRK